MLVFRHRKATVKLIIKTELLDEFAMSTDVSSQNQMFQQVSDFLPLTFTEMIKYMRIIKARQCKTPVMTFKHGKVLL